MDSQKSALSDSKSGALPSRPHHSVPKRCDCQWCAYCGCALAPRHEHDHFPVPKSLGGTETIPVCLSCHDLKDRVALEDWPAEAFRAAFLDITQGPPRILVARVLTELLRSTPKEKDA